MSKLTTLFKWSYTPANYFAEKISYHEMGLEIQIYDGKAEAIVRSEKSVRKHPTLRKEIRDELERQFFAEQLLRHKPYEIHYDGVEEENSEGKRNVIIEAETGIFKVTGYSSEITVIEKNGDIKYSSRKEREDFENSFRKKVIRASRLDPLSAHLADSYRSAVSEPENELVRLYEIKDALAKHYGGEHSAKKALGLSTAKWSRFGKICNQEPLNQGRHKGQHIGTVRDATDAELKEARQIALQLLEAHFDFINKANSPTT